MVEIEFVAKHLRTRRLSLFVALGVSMVAGCSDERTPTEPTDVTERSAGLVPAGQTLVRGHEVGFHEISQKIPGFGGYYYDRSGNLVVNLVDLNDELAAKALLEPLVKERDPGARERSTGQIVVRKVDFRFTDLSAWRDRATHPVLDIPGVEWTDLDEERNRFVVGLSTPGARSSVESVLRDQRVPSAAVLYEQSSRAVDDLTLRDFKRPLEGGYQIQRTGAGSCTLGFNAYWDGRASFLTNSHCTAVVWGMTGTNIYQNTQPLAAHFAGWEVADPAPFNCGGGRRCRWSDAAVIRKSSGATWSFARVAHTTGWGGPGATGSITIDAQRPSMTIIGELGYPTVGLMLDKMGRTAGWTYGFVGKTCVDMNKTSWAGGGTGRILCQDFATYRSDPGDSGSPVFRWYGNTVRLAGLNWGTLTSDGTRYGLMSAMWNIEHDLGPLTTY